MRVIVVENNRNKNSNDEPREIVLVTGAEYITVVKVE